MRTDFRSDKRRKGFTLIELIIVLLVLASLAALVVPTLGFVKDQSDTALSANGAQNVLNNLEMYRASTGSYPNRLDTLTNTEGEYYAAAFNAGGAFPFGTVRSAADMGNFTYYFGQGGGITSVAQHDQTRFDGLRGRPVFQVDPNAVSVATDLANASFCVIDGTFVGFFAAKGRRIINACYPNQTDPTQPAIPEGHTLVAMGVGGINSAIGNTMTDAPLCPERSGADPALYDRYIALFDVSPGSGRGRVRLKAVLDSQFELAATNVNEYRNSRLTDEQGIAPEPVGP